MISLRSSELDRTIECPASIVLAPMVDAREPEDVTTEGVALHHDGALRIVRDLGGSAPDGLPPPDPKWPSLKFSRWISDYYWRHVRDNCPAEFSLEVEAGLSYEFDGFILSGHIDCVAVSPDGTEAIGWDLKTGYDAVDVADQNWQILGYIILLLRAYPCLKKVTFFIVQPRNDEDEGFQRVSTVTLGEGVDLEVVTRTFVGTVKRAIESTDDLNTGRKQCTYCPASGQCPAITQLREEMKMKLTAAALAGIRETPDDATLADWAIAAKTLSKPIEDVMDLAKERIAAQGSITARDGTQITVKTTKGSIKILDPLGLWTALHGLLPGEKLAACARWSFTALKDAVADHMNIHKGGKGATTGETVVATATGKFVQQGERKTLTFT